MSISFGLSTGVRTRVLDAVIDHRPKPRAACRSAFRQGCASMVALTPPLARRLSGGSSSSPAVR